MVRLHRQRSHGLLLRRTLASEKDKLIKSSSSSITIVEPSKERPPSHEQVFEKLSEENVAEAAMMMFQRLITPSGESSNSTNNPRREHLLRMNTESLVLKTHEKPSLERYNVLISAQAERGDLDACLRSFERMREIHGILPNELTFVSILKACEINNDSERALAVIESLENAQIEPSETMYTMLGKMYAQWRHGITFTSFTTDCVVKWRKSCGRVRSLGVVTSLERFAHNNRTVKSDQGGYGCFASSCVGNV